MGLADGIFQMAQSVPQPQPSADAGDVRRSLTGLVPVVLGNLMGTPAKPPEAEQMAAAAAPLPPAPNVNAMIQPPQQQAPPMNGQGMANAIASQPPNSMPTLAPQNPTLGDRFKNFGSQFAMNLGDYLVQRGGGADPRFAQNAASNNLAMLNAQSEDDYRKSQIRIAEQNSRRVPVTLRDGSMAYIPQKDLAGYIKNLNTTQTSAANNAESNKTRLEVAGENNATKLEVAKNKNGMAIPLDKTTADLAGLPPEMVGKPMVKADWDSVNAALRAKGLKITDIGSKRVLVNAAGEVQHVMGDAPNLTARVAGAYAGARARAENTPFQTFDNEGNVVTTTAANAIKGGLPAATVWNSIYGPTGSTKTQGQAAGAVAEHIPAFKEAVQRLDAKGELGPVMGRLNTYLTQGYGGDDPDIAEFISTVGLLKSGAVRAHFGARGGAQVLNKFDSLLNTAQTAPALIGSINGIDGFLKTYKAVGTANPPKTNLNKPNQSSAPPVNPDDEFAQFGGRKH